MSVLLPEPLGPTSAVVVPAGASNVTSRRTGCSGSYSKLTFSNTMRPLTAPSGSSAASSSSSVATSRISRIRSSPAKASVICVPIAAISTTGAATSAVKNTYITKSPSVISPARIDCPPTTIITTPITPTITVEKAETADTPVSVATTLRRRRCAPRAKTRVSRRSAE